MKKQKLLKPIPLEDRKRLFDIKHIQLEQRRASLASKIKQEEMQAKFLLAGESVREISSKAKKKAKRLLKKAAYDAKYAYVAGGHAKNEFLGWLTIFSFHRSRKVKTARFIHYDEKDKRLYLDTYCRKDIDKTKKSKVFVYIHGGGWIGGLPETREAYTTRLAEMGYFVASICYGDAPFFSHPRMIENVYKAFAWLIGHADELNIDMSGIFVGGESAGAHLSAMAGAISTNAEYNALFDLDERSRHIRIDGLMLNCGVFDMEKAVTTGFHNIEIYTQSYLGGVPITECDEKLKKQISPIYWITEKFPSTFAISAENDKLAVLTFDLVEKLYENGIEFEHYHGEGKWAVHAFPIAQFLKISKDVMALTKEFFEKLQNAHGEKNPVNNTENRD